MPSGLLGIVLASLVAAYMSTISTQLNWGSSYIVFDYYKQHVNPDASEKRLVAVGRFSTVMLMILSAGLALLMQNAMEIFEMMLLFGAGTGLIFILHWFWWRINSWTQISAMFASGILSITLKVTPFGDYLFAANTGVFPTWFEIPFVVLVTTIIWVIVTLMTQPESKEVLHSFYDKIQPGGPGWSKVIKEAQEDGVDLVHNKNEGWNVPSGIIAMLLGCILIYSCMFSTGYWIYGETTLALSTTISAVVSGFLLVKTWKKIRATAL